MKYKKYSYILLLILMLVVGINKTYALLEGNENELNCYFISEKDDFRAMVKLRSGYPYLTDNTTRTDFNQVYIDKIEDKVDLPEPFVPRIPTTSPFSTSNVISFNA